MNAQDHHKRPQNPEVSTDHAMKNAFTRSVLFHILIFIIAFLGIPFAQKDKLIVAPVSVELLDISELSQSKPAEKPKDKPKPIEKPKEPEPPKPKPAPEPPKPKVEEPDPVPPPEPEKPKEKPKDKPKPKEPEPKKEEPKKQENDFSSLLKDLTPGEEETPQEPSETPSDNFANKISASELDSLRGQIAPCWNIPTGAKYAENLVVTLRLEMNRDASPASVRVIRDGGKYNRDAAFRAAADSAMRAVRNPRCSPFKLPPEKYDQWKTIVINFDPSDVL